MKSQSEKIKSDPNLETLVRSTNFRAVKVGDSFFTIPDDSSIVEIREAIRIELFGEGILPVSNQVAESVFYSLLSRPVDLVELISKLRARQLAKYSTKTEFDRRVAESSKALRSTGRNS